MESPVSSQIAEIQKDEAVLDEKYQNTGSIEQKYRSQLKETIENNQRMQAELAEKVKFLEKENRQLQNRL